MSRPCCIIQRAWRSNGRCKPYLPKATSIAKSSEYKPPPGIRSGPGAVTGATPHAQRYFAACVS